MSNLIRVLAVCAVLWVGLIFAVDRRLVASDFVAAASCSQAHVQDAINRAGNGNTVNVPAGSCTWTTSVVIPSTKGITLQGAGIDRTIIVDGVPSGNTLSVNVVAGNAVTYVTGFTFNANQVTKSGALAQIGVSGSGLDRFRVHHNKIINLKTRGIRVQMGGHELSGVIDHNTIATPNTSGSVQGTSIFGAGSEDSAAFSRPLELGSNKFIFIEDNTFQFASPQDGALDAYGGARYVFRYNAVYGTAVGHHGADSGGYRGVHSFEIYRNAFTNNTGLMERSLFLRSGTGVVFDNTWTGDYSGANIDNYRSCASYAPWGQCNGSSSWDQNNVGSQICLDQVGRTFAQHSGGSNILNPLRFWGNIRNGSPLHINVVGGRCAALQSHVVEGRDYYNDVPRPGYTPYTYPHPLVTGGVNSTVPSAPSNVRIVR